ncbi:hypothetical protein FNV43_RR04803 [Rhamnella rubrinervis]|uniref:Glabrous enhancer-binding protein-like DBD domain-containing protein n=1 Tax=Rhamnella rubrinervis TaxID=2594499 RepID=A0A8K0MPX1_9ROSA|nr:hypothetical protein FNV43_RR04803 [Rhamnella rubrinervis]
MASEHDDAVLPEEDLDSSSQDDEEDDAFVVDEVDEDEEDDDDDIIINSASPSTSSAGADSLPVAVATASASAVTVALPSIPNGEPPPSIATTVIADPSDPARHRSDHSNNIALALQPEEKKPALDDSRRLFQRLWTDEDEIELLQGFLDYTTQRGKTTHHGQNDTALFYDQIKSKLQLDFNKNQLVEKLRRLKKKYRNVVSKISSGKEFTFKSPHDQATFEISRKIWSDIGRIGADDNALEDDDSNPNLNNPNYNHMEVKSEETGTFFADKKTPRSRKRSRPQSALRNDDKRGFIDSSASKDNTNNNAVNNNSNSNNNVQGTIEETVKSCLSPLFKELLSNAMGGPYGVRGFGLALNPMPLSFGGPSMNFGSGEVVDEKWRKQQILELEVYSKRLELVQDQIKVALEELRSKGG